MIAYKLLRKLKSGAIAPLFIDKKLRLDTDVWYDAEFHPTPGFFPRKGFHCCLKPYAPHLKEEGRVWCKVEIEDFEFFERPASQGSTWALANRMKVLEVYH